MPTIYLSPSTQDWNQYVTGSGSEEYNMNRLADALVPYLRANAILYRRNRPHPTPETMICILHFTPTLRRKDIMARSGASSPSTIPAAPRGDVRQSCLQSSCGRSTRCPIE